MTKRRKFQCIGGPICGRKLPMNLTGWATVARRRNLEELHYYRMCCVQDSIGKVAQYWHYVGNEPVHAKAPSLFPDKRFFKWAGGK